MPNHNPPWADEQRPDGWYVVAIATDDRRVVCGPLDRSTAKLISSAHLLLAAVKAFLKARTPLDINRAKRIARNAVAQVEGP